MKRLLRSCYTLSTLFICMLPWSLNGCSRGNFVTPPTQTFGNSLNSRAREEQPHFSYDGRYLVFTSDRHQKRTIFLYDAIAGRMLSLPGLNRPNSIQEQPEISADGRYIVYLSEEQGKPDIYLYDRQSMQTRNLTHNIMAEVRNPTISGNGRFIAFERNRNGQWNIEIYDRGAGLDRLSVPPQSSSQPNRDRRSVN